MLRLTLVLGAIFVTGFAGLCGGASGQPEATPVSDEAFLYAAQVAANGANLTINDFPAGWEGEPQEPDDDDDDEELPEGFSPECLALWEQFEESAPADTEAVASAESDDFGSHDVGGLSTEVEVYRTVEEASSGESLFVDTFATCGDELFAWMEQSINEDAAAEGEDYRVSNMHMLPVEEPALGEWALQWGFGVTYHIEGTTMDATFTFTFIRSGRVGGSFSQFDFGKKDEPLITALRELFASRLAAADASLPE